MAKRSWGVPNILVRTIASFILGLGLLPVPCVAFAATTVQLSSPDVQLNLSRGTRTLRAQIAYNVSVRYLGATNIASPVRLVIDAITGGVGQVDSPDGVTASGQPYITLMSTGSMVSGDTTPTVPFRIDTQQRVGFQWHVDANSLPPPDTIKPVLSIPPNITVELGADTTPAGTGQATATDNGPAAPTITFVDTNNLNLDGTGTISRLWTATDGVGLTASSTQIITIIAPPVALAVNIAEPVNGSVQLINLPPIKGTFAGTASPSLTFTSGGNSLPASCQLTVNTFSCDLTNSLPEGAVTMVATIDDGAGVTAVDQVSFAVDSVPLAISIISPSQRLVTGLPDISVTGTLGSGVDRVEVNGVAATIATGTFSARVPLRQGLNMLVAEAFGANNKTGTDSVDITQDLVAPIVQIDSPRNNFTSIIPKVTVTGLVNDLVTGGVNPRVFVNGIEATVNGGTFLAMNIPLVRGPNTLEAVGTDLVGNVGRHSIQVTYQKPVGARLIKLSGDGQVEIIKQDLPLPLAVQVTDDLGNPVAGKAVRFEVTRNNGTLRSTSAAGAERALQITTDGSGKASVIFRLGDKVGEGNNRVHVTALGVAGEWDFCSSGLPDQADKIIMTEGDNQRGVVSNPLPTPLEALVVDKSGNPIKGVPVTFNVSSGAGNLNGTASQKKLTDVNGKVRTTFTLGPLPGINNNIVVATYPGLAGASASYVASAVVPGLVSDTRFSGVVLDNALTPIPGAIASIDGTTLQSLTDAEGRFLISGVPVGKIHLVIDPSNTSRVETFPKLKFESVTIAGQNNTLGMSISIPPLNTENSKLVGGAQDVVLSMANVPGLQLKVFANSATFPNGAKTGQLTISQVQGDKVPMPPPGGILFIPPAWTIQPIGTTFSPPAEITLPNNGSAPGTIVDIFSFDHDLFVFTKVGQGTVSEDGLNIISDSGFGITHAGWGGGGPPPPPPTCTPKCDDSNSSECSVTNYSLVITDKRNCIYKCVPSTNNKNGKCADGCGVCGSGKCSIQNPSCVKKNYATELGVAKSKMNSALAKIPKIKVSIKDFTGNISGQACPCCSGGARNPLGALSGSGKLTLSGAVSGALTPYDFNLNFTFKGYGLKGRMSAGPTISAAPTLIGSAAFNKNLCDSSQCFSVNACASTKGTVMLGAIFGVDVVKPSGSLIKTTASAEASSFATVAASANYQNGNSCLNPGDSASGCIGSVNSLIRIVIKLPLASSFDKQFGPFQIYPGTKNCGC